MEQEARFRIFQSFREAQGASEFGIDVFELFPGSIAPERKAYENPGAVYVSETSVSVLSPILRRVIIDFEWWGDYQMDRGQIEKLAIELRGLAKQIEAASHPDALQGIIGTDTDGKDLAFAVQKSQLPNLVAGVLIVVERALKEGCDLWLISQ